ELRQSMITYLKKIDKSQKQWIEDKLFQQLIELESWKKSMVVGITISQGIEWDTRTIIRRAWNQGKAVCVPKCSPGSGKMCFYRIDTFEQLEKAYANLLEPNTNKAKLVVKSQIDLLIVPGVLFNKQGFRIGFGGGFYDRFLQDFANETISLASEAQIVGNLPIDPFDIPVQQILTENGLIREGW